MKNSILLLTMLTLFFSCSDDENTVNESEDDTTTSIIRVTEVDASLDLVVLSNLGSETIDVGSYWLCLGPGTYVNVADATTEVTNLAPNESITLSYDVDETADGLSLFSVNTFGSSDPEVLVDYVQWGAGNQARVDQAVTAGRWNSETDFVNGGPIYTFTGEASDFGVTYW